MKIRIEKCLCVSLCYLLIQLSLSAQTPRVESWFEFRSGVSEIDQNYKQNSKAVSELTTFLEDISKDTNLVVKRVSYYGTASPEGTAAINLILADRRIKTLETLVNSKISYPDSCVTRKNAHIAWDRLDSLLSKSSVSYKQDALEIIHSVPEEEFENDRQARVRRLMELNRGKSWQDMLNRFFSRMRYAAVIIETERREPVCEPFEPVPSEEPVPAEPDTVHEEPEPAQPEPAPAEEPAEPEPAQPELAPAEELKETAPSEDTYIYRMYVSTNAVQWALGLTNLAVEFDLAPHLSFAIPVFYSGWDYFKRTIKFRALGTQPELRYWFKEKDGWFIGAHFGVSSYNFATKGDYRIQDHDGKTPALGGGLSAGYRLPVSKDGHWKIDFALGVGAYALRYDKFVNEKNGMETETVKKTYVGPDIASISVTYAFGIGSKRRNGK